MIHGSEKASGFEVQSQHVVQEFRIDQHVEADRHQFAFALDHGRTDLVMDAEDFEEEMARHFQVRADFEQCAGKRDRADQAAHLRSGAEVMADEDDVAGPVEIEFPVSTFRLGVFCVEVHLKGPFSLRL